MENPAFSAKTVSIVIRILLGFLFISLLVGQVVRFALPGQGGGILLSDISSALLIACSSLFLLLGLMRQKFSSSLLTLLVILPFLIWSICILIARSSLLGQGEVAIALSYWVRLTVILLLYPIGMAAMGVVGIKGYVRKVFVITYLALVAVGFLQLLWFPSLEGLGGGWDPHNQRMVATWLDPNFFGAFLGIALLPVMVWVRAWKKEGVQVTQMLYFSIVFLAILLTRSRSTYVAAFIALCVCAGIWLLSSYLNPLWKKVVVPLVMTIIIVVGVITAILQERVTQVFLHDPTISLRLEAYGLVWDRIVGPHIFFGLGYNAYQFAARDAGLISDFLIHSRSGSDSSILTLLATTGILGAILFLTPILIGFVWHIRRWLYLGSYQSLAFIWATVFLAVHSQFENSLFYPHLLIAYIFIAILTL